MMRKCEVEECDLGRENLYKAFELMKGVKSLDMCSFNSEHKLAFPPPLFPEATSIRTGGRISYAFFRSMISSPTSVKFLELDNGGGLGQLADSKPLQWSGNRRRPPESDSPNGNPETRHPGPMRGHLRPIQSQVANLQHLHIRIVEQYLFEDSRWFP
jgi:hypothetical protein